MLHAISDRAIAAARTVKTNGDFTTASTTFVDITGASASITIAANSRILIMVTGNTENTNASAYSPVDVVIDSTSQGGTFGLAMNRQESAAGVVAMPVGICFLSDQLSAGLHTVKLQLRATGGTSKVYASATAPLILSLLEVPA